MSVARLLFFDFDDTLYSHALGHVPPAVLERLTRLDRARDLLVVATGRGPESVDFLRRSLGFLPPVLALLNGQVILVDGVRAHHQFITLPSLGAILRKARAHGFAYGGYDEDGELVSRVNERVSAVWARFGCPVPRVLEDFGPERPLYQGHLYLTREESARFAPELEDYLTNWSDPYLMNLIPRQAGKSAAVRWCMERWRCSREQTYAFGDGFNDVDMLRAVGHGVAVGDGNPALTAAAELVVPPASQGGLLQALQAYEIG